MPGMMLGLKDDSSHAFSFVVPHGPLTSPCQGAPERWSDSPKVTELVVCKFSNNKPHVLCTSPTAASGLCFQGQTSKKIVELFLVSAGNKKRCIKAPSGSSCPRPGVAKAVVQGSASIFLAQSILQGQKSWDAASREWTYIRKVQWTLPTWTAEARVPRQSPRKSKHPPQRGAERIAIPPLALLLPSRFLLKKYNPLCPAGQALSSTEPQKDWNGSAVESPKKFQSPSPKLLKARSHRENLRCTCWVDRKQAQRRCSWFQQHPSPCKPLAQSWDGWPIKGSGVPWRTNICWKMITHHVYSPPQVLC